MTDYASKKDVQNVVAKSTNEILEVMQAFMYQVDERFKQTEKRFDDLTNLIDGYASKIDSYAQEMAAMDHKINRLEKYIQVLAEKAGVDLDKVAI